MKNPLHSVRSTFQGCRASVATFFSRLASRDSEIHSSKRSFASAWLRGRDNTMTPALMLSPYQQSTWVYSCVSTLAESVSAIPFRLVHATPPLPSHGTLERIANRHSEIVNLFDRPHPQMDRFQFWELIVSWLTLRGEAFILPLSELDAAASRHSPVKHLLVLNPDCFQEVIVNHRLEGWRYQAFGSSTPFPSQLFLPEEIIHIKLPNPFHFWRGLSPLTIACLAAQTDYAASQFMKGVMLNNADTGLIISTPEQLSPDQLEEVKATLRERKRAVGSADRPLFLWGGARVERPTISTTDLQFLENRKFNRQELCAIFKVPQELLGFTEDANRSVSESARLNFFENRILPLCRRLEAAFQPLIDQVVGTDRRAVRVRAEFHVKGAPIMQAAQRARVDTAVKLFNLGIPVNVINQNLDLGFPHLPHGQNCYVPVGVQNVGQLPFPPAPGPLPESATATFDPNDPCDRLLCSINTYFTALRARQNRPAAPKTPPLLSPATWEGEPPRELHPPQTDSD